MSILDSAMNARATRFAALIALVAASVSGCADAESGGPSVSRQVAGDTTIVRIAGVTEPESPTQELIIGELEGADEYTFGSVTGIAVADDGTIYVLDRQTFNIRVYSPDGTYLRSFAGEGEGPGELKQPSQMTFLTDGRLIVRDPANARMNLYSAEGKSLTTWPIPGGFFTGNPIYTDSSGNIYTDVITEPLGVRPGAFNVALLRFDSAGQVIDTLARPFADYETPSIRAEQTSGDGRRISMSDIPFWPQAYTTMNRRGEFVGGIADSYVVLTWHGNGTILRIERDRPPVPVDPAEAEAAMEMRTRNMRELDAGWRWDAPQPPEIKPAYTEIRVGDDDRIWVRVSQPAVRQTPDPDAEPDAQGRPPVDQWIEPRVYEVFEPNGDFVGTVRLPDRFQPMVMRGTHVWGVLRDEFDVQYVARLRVLE